MKKYCICPHGHYRDQLWAYKATIEHEMRVARSQGIEVVFDMCNNNPLTLRREDVIKRLTYVPEEYRGHYFLYIGATSNPEQLKEAVECYNTIEEVIGIKLFAGKSVGDLAVIKEEEQLLVYETLTELSYKGVIAVHCEKEKYLKPELWNPKKPVTHAFARPAKAEIESIKDQIKFVEETGFNGNLHVCHVSHPLSVKTVDAARSNINITCGVTPHHSLWSYEMLERPDGLLYKMNPPLRSPLSVKWLNNYLAQGLIDWIETDHAPHQVGEKMHPPYMSGYPSLYLYKDYVENFLPSLGLNEMQIQDLTHNNILNVFSNKLEALC